jgi:hypothetical protein
MKKSILILALFVLTNIGQGQSDKVITHSLTDTGAYFTNYVNIGDFVYNQATKITYCSKVNISVTAHKRLSWLLASPTRYTVRDNPSTIDTSGLASKTYVNNRIPIPTWIDTGNNKQTSIPDTAEMVISKITGKIQLDNSGRFIIFKYGGAIVISPDNLTYNWFYQDTSHYELSTQDPAGNFSGITGNCTNNQVYIGFQTSTTHSGLSGFLIDSAGLHPYANTLSNFGTRFLPWDTAYTKNVSISDTAQPLIIKSPDGSHWKVRVNNSGVIKATKL